MNHCTACGKVWIEHKGVEPTCAELQKVKRENVELRDRIAALEKLTHCDKAAHTDLNIRLK